MSESPRLMTLSHFVQQMPPALLPGRAYVVNLLVPTMRGHMFVHGAVMRYAGAQGKLLRFERPDQSILVDPSSVDVQSRVLEPADDN